jgi:hypothetical protein
MLRFVPFTSRILYRGGKVSRSFTDIHEQAWDWKYDILLTDVTEEEIRYIHTKLLGKKYLETVPASDHVVYPVRGTVYNPDTNRVFVSMIVARGSKRIHVPFLIDGGCPGIYLARDTLHALGYTDTIPSSTRVNIQGFDQMTAFPSPALSHFSYANILGQKFFHQTGVKKVEDIRNGEVFLYHPKQALPTSAAPDLIL